MIKFTVMKNPYKKYRNPDKNCQYPFTPDPVGYCWGYATLIDNLTCPTCKRIIKPDEMIVRSLCSGCEFWKGRSK